MFLEFDLRGWALLSKNTPIMTFDFHLSWNQGCVGSKSCIKQKSDRHLIYRGALFINSAFNIFFALLSGFQKCVTRPPCPKTPGGDRFGGILLFGGRGLTPRAAGSGSPALKLLAKS